jgi:hypothetical protein
MIKKIVNKTLITGIAWFFIIFIGLSGVQAQQTDTSGALNLYRPQKQAVRDTIRTVPQVPPAISMSDSLQRAQFVKDSLLAREQFVRDSIRHHQMVLDSLTFLQKQFQVLLGAYFRTTQEDIILRTNKITVVGDTLLSDYSCILLPLNLIQPYKPWKTRTILADKAIRVNADQQIHRITSIQAPFMKCSFKYNDRGNILVIQERNSIQPHYSDQLFKVPFDSVFFDQKNRIVRIKKYIQYHTVVNKNQQGTPLFLFLSQIMQYEYGAGDEIAQYKITKYCERWKVYDPIKICTSTAYSFTSEANTYTLKRSNTPANNYADGTYTFVFGEGDVLKSISFHNLSNTENWQRDIELNKDGNVNCYYDKTNDIIKQSFCFIYHDKDPKAKYPIETITTTFEGDGISYYQRNNTTGQSRTRDRMTLEWTPWHE